MTRGWGLSHHFTFLPVERDALGLPSGQSPAASPSPQLRGGGCAREGEGRWVKRVAAGVTETPDSSSLRGP